MSAPSTTTAPPASSSSRWAGSADSTPAFAPNTRGRGRGNGRGRGGRGGGRGGGASRDLKGTDKPSQEKPKPTPAKINTTPAPSDPNERAPSTPRTKYPSRRSSRSTPAPIITQLATQSTDLQSPSSASRTPNSRRRQSQTSNKGPSLPPKIKVVPEEPAKQTLPSVPPTAALTRDAPPHLASSHSPAEMKSNIDALVERVRAVAMAENRPSTPGSHIDWAGDDDDSLPDLNDWGISTINPAQTISPIIVDGLKPLPEPIATPIYVPRSPVQASSPSRETFPHGKSQEKFKHSGLSREFGQVEVVSQRGNGRGKNNRPTRSGSASTSPLNRRGRGPPPPPLNAATSPKEQEETKAPEPESAGAVPENGRPQAAKAPDIKVAIESPTVAGIETITTPSSTGRSLTDSIHASTSAHNALFESIGNDSGLAASIHAPKSLSDSTSAPPTFSNFNNVPWAPRNEGFGHSRRPASFNNPRNRPNNSTQRGGPSHARNHSSPSTSSFDVVQKSPHARPIISGAAKSLLAKTIGSTAPKSAPAISSSTE